MSYTRRSFIGDALKSVFLMSLPCAGKSNEVYETFESYPPVLLNNYIHVIGVGDGGRGVISQCEQMSLSGINYMFVDVASSMNKSVSLDNSNTHINNLVFLVLDVTEADTHSKALSVAREVRESSAVLVTLLSSSGVVDEIISNESDVKNIITLSDSVIDCTKLYDICIIQNQVNAISALTQSVIKQAFFSVDYNDVLYFIRKSPYIRSLTVNPVEYGKAQRKISQITNGKDIIDFIFVNVSGENLVLTDIEDTLSSVPSYGDSIVVPSYLYGATEKRTYLLGLKTQDVWRAVTNA